MADETDARSAMAASLNRAQLEAVRSTEGPHLVVAGAGTGKTRTLVYRVAHLVATGVPPEAILLLTFTRRAASEMLHRATQAVDERCNRVAGGTFHSFANLVLRRYARHLGYDPSFTILDRSDAADLVGILRVELGLDKRRRRFPRKDTIVDLLSKQVNTRRDLTTLLDEDYPQFVDEVEPLAELARLFQQRKKEQNVMDYDDLLLNLRSLLVQQADVREHLSAAYRYIMVDEYQDTNRLQAHIVALLAARHGNIMVVGDEAQSIYSFRGADFRNIMDFPRIFDDCSTILLERNYRSTQPILDLGNAILESATERFEKRLHNNEQGGTKPIFARVPDDAEQAGLICDHILELREEGIALRDIAVLSRAAWHTNSLEIELGRRNIPFRKFGGQRFVEAAHVKDLSAMLRVALNPLDASSWFRILQLLDRVGARRAQQMCEILLRSSGDVEQAFVTHFRSGQYGTQLRELCIALQEVRRPAQSVDAQVRVAIEHLQELMPSNYDDYKRRAADLESVAVIAQRYEHLESLLTDIAIDPPTLRDGRGERDTEDEWVTVSTVHSAKGLEWHTVFIVNLTSGHFPGFNSLNDPADYEEERRLLYVAVTRAKRRLYLIKPEQMSGRGAFGGGFGELSPLLQDLGGFDQLTEAITYSRRQEPTLSAAEQLPIDSERLQRIQDYFDD